MEGRDSATRIFTMSKTTKINKAELRRIAFAEHIAAGKTGTEAARLVGYSGNDAVLGTQACRMLKNAEVQAMIRAASEKASKVRVFDAAARREILRKIAEGEIEQEITTETSGAMGSTSSVQKRKPTGAERAAAIKHLDELDGLIRQKVEHSGPNGAPIGAVLATVDEATIRERIAELAKRKGKK
jgi:phage terminase small subunit